MSININNGFVFMGDSIKNNEQNFYSQKSQTTILKENNSIAFSSGTELNFIFDSISHGIWEWDVENNIFYYNTRFAEILGYQTQELPIHLSKWSELIHPIDSDRIILFFNEHLIGITDEFQTEFRIKCKNGTWKAIQLHGKIIERNHSKIASKIIGIQTDLLYHKIVEETLCENDRRLMQQNEELTTFNEELSESNRQMREINRQLTEAKEKAIESEKLKAAFLANMSHEIRTPLNGIVGFANLLMDENISKESIKQYVDIINSSAYQLVTIINDILDLSKIDAGQIKIATEQIELNHLIQELIVVHEINLNSNVTIEFIPPTPNPVVLKIDGLKLRQILNNILDNAVKYTTLGKITFTYTMDEKRIFFKISDTGKGIATENHSKIFERFFQINSEFHGKNKGTGLGLSISKAFVELMNGKIWLESEISKGSTFYIELPYEKVLNKPDDSKEINTIISKNNWEGKTILIAEDEELNYFLLKELIGSFKCKIIWAENGENAVKYCVENPNISLILMDLKMPIMDGYEATRQIKKIRPDIPIIAQTAYTQTNEKQKALEAGCNNYITKPINRITLVEMIEYLISQ